MTFSMIARCADTGQFGMVVSSSSPAVAARCVHVRSRVGVAASQNITDPVLGMDLLNAMEGGLDPDQAMRLVLQRRPHTAYRQLMALDSSGKSAFFSGAHILGCWSEAAGEDCAAGGNLLASEAVPQAMIDAFTMASGHLGARLIFALKAGLAAGGEAGPVHSAGMKIMGNLPWPLVDLRIDWTLGCPIAALEAAWDVYYPQIGDYVQRAQNPTEARSYGVPGDE